MEWWSGGNETLLAVRAQRGRARWFLAGEEFHRGARLHKFRGRFAASAGAQRGFPRAWEWGEKSQQSSRAQTAIESDNLRPGKLRSLTGSSHSTGERFKLDWLALNGLQVRHQAFRGLLFQRNHQILVLVDNRSAFIKEFGIKSFGAKRPHAAGERIDNHTDAAIEDVGQVC